MGSGFVATLSQELVAVEFGRGFELSNLDTNGEICRGLPQRGTLVATLSHTIELVAFPGAPAVRQAASARFLRGDVSPGGLERYEL